MILLLDLSQQGICLRNLLHRKSLQALEVFSLATIYQKLYNWGPYQCFPTPCSVVFSGGQTTMGACNRANDNTNGKNDGSPTVTSSSKHPKQKSNAKSNSTTDEPTKKLNPIPIISKQTALKVGCWNIRRGLVKRELELIVSLECIHLIDMCPSRTFFTHFF